MGALNEIPCTFLFYKGKLCAPYIIKVERALLNKTATKTKNRYFFKNILAQIQNYSTEMFISSLCLLLTLHKQFYFTEHDAPRAKSLKTSKPLAKTQNYLKQFHRNDPHKALYQYCTNCLAPPNRMVARAKNSKKN